MTLKELRAKWEKPNSEEDGPVLEVSRTDPNPELYVLFQKVSDDDPIMYCVLHYFTVGGTWTVSIDVDWNSSITVCLAAISVSMKDLVPG